MFVYFMSLFGKKCTVYPGYTLHYVYITLQCPVRVVTCSSVFLTCISTML